MPCPPPGDLPKQGIEPRSPTWQVDSLLSEPPGKPDVTDQFSHSIRSDSCDPMDCSLPGFPVHHKLLEPTQTHVHRIGNAIQPSHPLLTPSLPTFNLSQHQGLFFFFSFIFISWRLITILYWFLPYIEMNQPWIYMCSPS